MGRKEGEGCAATAECAPTLVCSGESKCARPGQPGTQGKDDGCASNLDCQAQYVCASFGKCADPGNASEGQECKGNESCGKGLLCSGTLKCAKPGAPGTKLKGEACGGQMDCSLGLVCYQDKCAPMSFWAGVSCNQDTGPLRSYFEIPRKGQGLAEFYQLPFPNNIRLKNGRVDVTQHPNPSKALPPELGEIVAEYLKAISEDVTGFGLSTAVFMRFSKTVDLGSLTVSGEKPTIQFYNIDKASSGYGNGVGLFMFASTSRGKYICDNWFAVRPTIGVPLAPKTTYALVLRKGVKDSKGEEVGADKDFKVVSGETEPTDADEKAAWQAYAPLRAFLKDKAIDPASVINAAVFTTMDPQARMARFRDVVQAQAAPKVEGLTLCDGTNKSPCDDGKDPTHACPKAADPAFHELQGTYMTPVFQKGKPPYKAIADGGAIVYDGEGRPTVDREEKVCFSLTVPKGPTPEGGWPVVVFGHGTGGHYRSFIEGGTAAALADVKDGAGADLSKMAVISIDGGMHGPRRASTDKPDELFFNLRNPRAARDNVYQAAADKFQLMRVLGALSVDKASSPTGEVVKLRTDKAYYFGHSQGTVEGLPFLAFEPGVQGTLLSGAGGYLLGSLMYKTKPVNIAAGVQLAMADGKVGTSHPLLNLLQLFFEEVDSLNYGRSIISDPNKGVGGKHVFLSYGVSDSYTPPVTIEALTRVMGLSQVNQPAERCGDGICGGSESCKTCEKDCKPDSCGPNPPQFKLIEAPVKENFTVGGKKLTGAMVPYASDGTYDDHFVIFQNPNGKKQSMSFFGTAVKDGAPTIVKP
ncbi:MAG: hypothetical protein IT371_10435 [Deltaproteobacteria bacterium]|nr:hypothetical protein [Deltaproteobacteria bacterium]